MSNETARGEVKIGEKYFITLDKDRVLYSDNLDYMFEEVKYALRHVEMMMRLIHNHNAFYTLNDIRSRLGAKRIRAEYEMCWGYDDPKDFKYEADIDRENQTIEIALSDPKDLRQYYEIRDKNIE